MTLARRFTPLVLLMISINGMVGSAWLFAPLYAAKTAGAAALIAWCIGGLGTVLIALTFAELSVMYPVAGGSAYLPQLSHDSLTSFMMSFIAWLSALTMAPIEVQAILQYASTYFSSLVHKVNGVPILTSLGLFWATILMVIFCLINTVSFKGLERFNFVLFVFKIVVIILTVIMLIDTQYTLTNFSNLNTAITTMTGWKAILTAVSTSGVAFAFTGFKHGVELAGEAQHAEKSVPLAIIGSVLICLLLYLGLQTAFIGALPSVDLQHGWAHLSFKGDAGPFAGLAMGLGLFWIAKLLYIDAAISPGGAGLIYVTSTARILYAMSKMGYMPAWLMRENKQQFPYTAIIFNFGLGMFLFLPLPGWQAMVSFLVSGMVLSYAMGPITLVCMRYSYPNKHRRFRLPCATFIGVISFYFCNLLSFWTGWDTIYKLAIALAIGFCLFLYAYYSGKIKNTKMGMKSACWLLPYLSGLVIISYLGTFGGGTGVISFGWDFLVIGIFSLIIFMIAIHYRET